MSNRSARSRADRSPLLRLWRLADPDLGRLALATLLATLALSSAVGLLVVSAWLISRASEQPPIMYLQVAIVAVRAFGLSRGVFRYAERLVGHDTGFRSLANVRVQVYRRLERLSPAGLGEYRRGDLLARLVGDVDSSVDLIVRVVLPVGSGLAAGTLAVAIGAAILPAAGAALLALLLIAGAIAPTMTALLGARSQQRRAAAEGRLSSSVVASLAAAPDLVAYNGVELAIRGVSEADAELTDLKRRTASAAGLGAALSQLATGLTVVACLGLGVSAVRAGRVDGVWLAALALIPLAMADVLSGMPAAALARSHVAGAAERICQVIDSPDPVPATRSATSPGSSGSPRCCDGADGTGPARTDLLMGGVSACYPAATADTIHDIDLDLPAGRHIAIVGPSGSGKSTVAAVLLRLLDHRTGQYGLGHAGTFTDVRDLGEEAVRKSIAAMDQQSHLFDTTIEENIRLANRDADDARIRAAIERAALADWVDGLPEGIQTRVGAHGWAVSGGQAQRIALARVLVTDRPIVVLDEPGEHLDPATADQVTAAALTAASGRSIVLITHRMAHTGGCAEVIELKGGRVVRRGAPTDLHGWYRDALAREAGSPTDCVGTPEASPAMSADDPSGASNG
ncbi:MAG: thiol reductant ABC exporter subunit CydC [Candidatus Nanopelagicales bacterium]